MRKLLFILTFIGLLGGFSLQAKEYTIKEIPMVHLQDRTRYVSNPDNILSPSSVYIAISLREIIFSFAY